MRLLGASGTRLATTGSGARWAPFRTDRAGRRDHRRSTALGASGTRLAQTESVDETNAADGN